MHSPSARLREPRLRPQGGHHAQPLYPPQGTRRSGTGGHSPAPPLPASGNHDSGLRGVIMHSPSARLREPRLRPQGGHHAQPLYPPQGTRRSGTGGHSPAPPLPASGNHDSGLRGVIMHSPSARLREPRLRHQGGHHAHPLCPPQGTTTPASGGSPCTAPLPASGNHDSRLRGPLSCTPSARLGLSPPRPPLFREHPLPPPGGTPTRPPAEPGHPTLKPGLLTRPTAPYREPGHWSPRERFTTGHHAST